MQESKRLVQENNTVPADAQTPAEPLDGAMNPPETARQRSKTKKNKIMIALNIFLAVMAASFGFGSVGDRFRKIG